eukprot:TRINITY_DN8614_c0_g1_i1.p2 TRINITY_DN8614_c0_g1~~TRINITY_DN8614_c0_g1_i1.p2  ORF type:complete len:115 (-),score=25.57 TRINITY_DN8614_c0_g1_i1:492-836(-)
MARSLTEPPSVGKNLGLWVFLLNIFFPGIGSIVAGAALSDLEVVLIGIVQLLLSGGAIGYVRDVVFGSGPKNLHFHWDYNTLWVAATIVGWVWSILYGYRMWQKSRSSSYSVLP